MCPDYNFITFETIDDLSISQKTAKEQADQTHLLLHFPVPS